MYTWEQFPKHCLKLSRTRLANNTDFGRCNMSTQKPLAPFDKDHDSESPKMY